MISNNKDIYEVKAIQNKIIQIQPPSVYQTIHTTMRGVPAIWVHAQM